MNGYSLFCLWLVFGFLFVGNGRLFGGVQESPNIILIITDDQGYGDLSCHGNPILKTPNLDRLFKDSIRFTNFHVSPTCAPTRSAIMTGRHEFKNGVTHTILERERMTLDAVTLPESLRDSGYQTGIFGKWHLGDENAYQPDQRGFSEVFIHGAGGIGQKYPGSCADAPPNQKKESRYFDTVIKHNGRFVKTKGFCTDVFFQQALGWINRSRKNEKPFFAYITTNAPHGPFIAPEQYKKRFLRIGLNNNLSGFYGMIQNIDDNIGILLDKLKEWNLERHTLVIFMTDNGSALGSGIFNAGMRGKKGTPHEGGTRVPLFMRWAGRQWEGGRDVNKLVGHIDLFPTLAEIGKSQIPEKQVEGRSLVPLLESADSVWQDRYLFTHVGRWKNGSDIEQAKFRSCAVRNSRFRFVNNKELFDMQNDPGQTENVLEKFPKVVRQMRAAYDHWWQTVRKGMVNENKTFDEPSPFIRDYNKQEETVGISDWKRPKF